MWNIVLYIIALLEWFTTLSVEIMAIRNSISIIWSNSISTSIILWIILIALSYWYYRWWIIASNASKDQIKKRIFFNLFLASILYICISFPFQNLFLDYFLRVWLGYFFSIFIWVSVLFILPVFLASQTIPLLSELIDSKKKWEVVWRLLFYSTIWSFLWSVTTSLVFFPFMWVINSIIFNSIILWSLSLVIILYNRHLLAKFIALNIIYIIFLIILIFSDINWFNSWVNKVYSFNSSHNDIEVFDNWEKRLFSMNWSYSSWIYSDTKKSYFKYIWEITKIIDKEKPKNILIIWAAWFSLPQDISDRDYIEKVDVCDIDYSLVPIAEKYFLKEELSEKIDFYPMPARFFLNKKIIKWEKYDFVFIDAYHWKISIPSQLLTKEFFEDIQKVSSWIISMNLIFDSAESSDFYKNTVSTISNTITDSYLRSMSWGGIRSNYIFINKNLNWYKKISWINWAKIYTDNKNTLEYDKYKLFYWNNKL